MIVATGVDTAAEENEALVTALRNTFMPRLLDRDASVFATLIKDLWPDIEVPLLFTGARLATPDMDREEKSQSGSVGSKAASRLGKSQVETTRSIRGEEMSLHYPPPPPPPPPQYFYIKRI